ncbi:mitogen-activated protein kinase kinase kinase 15-like [Ictidomys tridecemlineatus]
MESGNGTPLAGALGAAAESPQCQLPPGGEDATGLAEPDRAAEDAAAGSCGGSGGGPPRALRAIYMRSESSQGGAVGGPEAGALQCLLRACEAEGAHLTSVPFGELDFGELDFGETAVLDAFYDADVAFVDMSDFSRQPSLILESVKALTWPIM